MTNLKENYSYGQNEMTYIKHKALTKPWREIVNPTGTTISQVKRYVTKEHLYE